MIKIMFCLHRLPGLSSEAFHDHWLNRHAPLVAGVAPLLGIRRYVQSHRFAHAQLDAGNDVRGGAEAYDGVAELWFDSVEAATLPGATSEQRDAGRMLLEDERRFIDLPRSPLFWVREHEIVAFGRDDAS